MDKVEEAEDEFKMATDRARAVAARMRGETLYVTVQIEFLIHELRDAYLNGISEGRRREKKSQT